MTLAGELRRLDAVGRVHKILDRKTKWRWQEHLEVRLAMRAIVATHVARRQAVKR